MELEKLETRAYPLNSVKKIKRILSKGKWSDYVRLTQAIDFLGSTLEEYLKLYISTREFLEKNTPIGEREREVWENVRRIMETISDEYLK